MKFPVFIGEKDQRGGPSLICRILPVIHDLCFEEVIHINFEDEMRDFVVIRDNDPKLLTVRLTTIQLSAKGGLDYAITNIRLATIILDYAPISWSYHGKPGEDMPWHMQRQPAALPANSLNGN